MLLIFYSIDDVFWNVFIICVCGKILLQKIIRNRKKKENGNNNTRRKKMKKKKKKTSEKISFVSCIAISINYFGGGKQKQQQQ